MIDAKDVLQGKSWWMGPVHPAIIHLPVGLWSGALVFDIIAMCAPGNNAMVQAAFWCIVGGCVAAIIAMPFGLADWWDLKSFERAHRLGLYHMGINALALIIFLLDFALRVGHITTATSISIPQLIVSIVGNIVLWIAVLIGGQMVFDQGANVGRFSDDVWRVHAVAGGANVPEKE